MEHDKEQLIRRLDYLFSSVGKHFTNARKGFREANVSGPEFFLLRHIHMQGARSISQLAEQLALNQATVSNVVNSAAKKDLVVKEKDSKDRRVTIIQVTDKGRKTVNRLQQQRFKRFRSILNHLSTDELQTLEKIFSKLLDRLGSTGTSRE